MAKEQGLLYGDDPDYDPDARSALPDYDCIIQMISRLSKIIF